MGTADKSIQRELSGRRGRDERQLFLFLPGGSALSRFTTLLAVLGGYTFLCC